MNDTYVVLIGVVTLAALTLGSSLYRDSQNRELYAECLKSQERLSIEAMRLNQPSPTILCRS